MKLSNYVLDLRPRYTTKEGRKVDGIVEREQWDKLDKKLSKRLTWFKRK